MDVQEKCNKEQVYWKFYSMTKRKFKKNNVTNGLAQALGLPYNNAIINPNDLLYNASPFLLTLNWVPLTYAYKSNGFIQTAINQIVDDAFRNDGLVINSKSLNSDELELLKKTLVGEGDIEQIKDTIRWGQLYGGGVLVAHTEQNYASPLNEKRLKGRALKFLACDRWQCHSNGISPELAKSFTMVDNAQNPETGEKIEIHSDRVGIFIGIKAPFLIRSMLQGWGMSIFEPIISPLTQYLKAMNVALELLDEAKIDVIKIFNLSSLLGSAEGERLVQKRLEIATQNKNYKSSIAMDSEDDYQQKQISFGGIPEMIIQIQYLVCSALRRPYSKVFGKGSSGFSSGEDDLENYNTIVDAEIRTPAVKLIRWVVGLRCLQLFGRRIEDITITWKPLKVMSEKEEAEIKSRKLSDYMQLVDRGIMTKQQAAEHLTEDRYILFSQEEILKINNGDVKKDIKKRSN